MDEKECSRCSQIKPISEFGKAKMAADGMHPWCRPCAAAYARERRSRLPKKPDRRLAFRPVTYHPPNRKPQWGWRVTGHANVREVLRAILPYLITKRETAIEALAYIQTRPGAHSQET